MAIVVRPLTNGGVPPRDIELDTPAALEAAKAQAAFYGLETVCVSVNLAAPWNSEWRILTG